MNTLRYILLPEKFALAAMLHPAPVTVRWAVGVVCPPISRGLRYCRSAVEKWLVAMQATQFA